MPHSQLPIVRSSMVAELERQLRQLGIPVKPLLAEAGLDPKTNFEDPYAAVPLAAVMRLFELAAAATGAADFAIRFTEAFRSQASGLFGDVLRSAANVREMLTAVADFFPVYSTQMEARFSVEDGVGRIAWRYPASLSVPHIQYNVFVAAAIVSRVRLRSERAPQWKPLAVQFDHIAPGCKAALLRTFGTRTTFEAAENCILVDQARLAMPLVTANPSRFALASDLARRWVDETRVEADTTAQVRRVIDDMLGETQTDLESVAKAVGSAPRALQWRLGRAGTTFERMLSEARREQAERLLVNTNRPISTIAFKLGFSSQSAFTRAAQRWFGTSPRQMRLRARSEMPATPAEAVASGPAWRGRKNPGASE